MLQEYNGLAIQARVIVKRLKKMYSNKTDPIIRDIFYASGIQNITWAFVPSLDNSDCPNTPAVDEFTSRRSRVDSPQESLRTTLQPKSHSRNESTIVPETIKPEAKDSVRT